MFIYLSYYIEVYTHHRIRWVVTPPRLGYFQKLLALEGAVHLNGCESFFSGAARGGRSSPGRTPSSKRWVLLPFFLFLSVVIVKSS